MSRPSCRIVWVKHRSPVRKHKRCVHADNLCTVHGVMVRAVVRSRSPTMPPTFDHLVGADALLLHGLPEGLIVGIEYGGCRLGAGHGVGTVLEQGALVLALTDDALSFWHRFASFVRSQDPVSGRFVNLVSQGQRPRPVLDNEALNPFGGLHRLSYNSQPFSSRGV